MRLTLISYAPDPAPHLIPAGMIQRHLIMTNDAIIEIRNIESAIGAQLDIHRPEPGILAQQKIRFHLANRTGTVIRGGVAVNRSEEHTSELQSLMRISYAVFCLKKKKK